MQIYVCVYVYTHTHIHIVPKQIYSIFVELNFHEKVKELRKISLTKLGGNNEKVEKHISISTFLGEKRDL